MKKHYSKGGFTLVELIIVIAIIAILAVTAFLMLTKWLGKSRDARRASDISTIDTSLQLYIVEKNTVPTPDNAINITASGAIIGFQGLFTDNTKSAVGNITSTPKDPSDNVSYVYYADKSLKNYQLLGFTESQMSYGSNVANAIDYSTRFIQTKGNKLGILLSGDNTPVNLIAGITGLDIQTTNGTYNAYFDNTTKISGTGFSLQWLYSNVNNGGPGFDAPSSCPTGFIPVPGNQEYNQPGFCVARYEMKQSNGTAGNAWRDGANRQRNVSSTELCGTGATTICRASSSNTSGATNRLDGQIISKADGMPIVNLNQPTAIEACQAMGSGYHLITNKERMTVARNIEQQSTNRTGGKVGSGGLYRGKNLWYDSDYTVNKDATNLDCKAGQNWDGTDNYKSLVEDGNNTACKLSSGRNKREQYLSNGQTIWDLAGNVWEHVNKADSIDGTGFSSAAFLTSTACTNGNNRRSFSGNDGVAECGWTNGYNYNLVGPKTAGLNSANGIGRIYSYNTANNVFLRGGGGYAWAGAGVFTLYLTRGASYQNGDVGFRCVK